MIWHDSDKFSQMHFILGLIITYKLKWNSNSHAKKFCDNFKESWIV